MALNWIFALKNLGRNKKRNLATGSAIAIGYAGLLLLSGFVIRMEKSFRAATIYINHTGSVSVWKQDGVKQHLLQPRKASLSAEEQAEIVEVMRSEFPNAELIASHLDAFALIGNGCKVFPVRVMGVDPQLEQKIFSHPKVNEYASDLVRLAAGRGLWEHNGIVPISITPKVARRIGKPNVYDSATANNGNNRNSSVDCLSPTAASAIQDDTNVQLAAPTFQNDFSAIDLEIVNHYASGFVLLEESTATVPLKALQQLFETDSASYVAAYLPWDANAKESANRLREKLTTKGMAVDVYHYGQVKVSPFYAGFMNLIYVMSACFLGLTLIIVTLTVADTMTMSVLERTREIGTLRSMGFARREVIRLFEKEGIMLAMLCLPIGILIAKLTSLIINALDLRFSVPGLLNDTQIIIDIDPIAAVVVALLLIAVTILAGHSTSRRTTHRNIMQLLSTQVS